MKGKSLGRRIRPYLFLLPIYVLMITFKYIPFLTAIQKSFYKWNGTNINIFVGLQNYIDAFQDSMFLAGLKNSVIIAAAYVLIVITVPVLAAELLFAVRSKKAQYVIRTAFTFPMVVPSVVIVLLWKWLLAGDTGVINNVLSSIGLDALVTPWLADSSTALGAIIFIGFPWLGSASLGGLQLLLYYGSLQSISSDLFEAAKMDGCTTWMRFRYIDLPMMSSQIKLAITLAIINALQVFDSVYILTKGGPGTATMTPSVVLYQQGFTYKSMGYASAIGVIMFLIIMVLTVINQKLLKDTEHMD